MDGWRRRVVEGRAMTLLECVNWEERERNGGDRATSFMGEAMVIVGCLKIGTPWDQGTMVESI